MKYVMFKVPMGKDMHRLVPVLFDELLVHKNMADWLAPHIGMPVSAGFYDVMSGEVSGRSDSLKMHPAPDDEKIILMCQYGLGIREGK